LINCNVVDKFDLGIVKYLKKNDFIAKQTIMCKIKAKKYQTWQFLHKSSKNMNKLYLFLGHPSICAEEIYFKNTILALESFLAIFFTETGHRKKERNANIHIYFCQSECRESSLQSRNKFHFRLFGKLSFSATYPFHSKNLKQYPMSFKTRMAR
jgi:hypothetical protein